MKPPRIISHNGYSITLTEATILQGVRRSILNMQMQEQSRPDDDQALKYLRLILYPAAVSAVSEQQGFGQWPISFEEFIGLPETLALPWEEAVFELNPHWRPGGGEAVSVEEKKESTTSLPGGPGPVSNSTAPKERSSSHRRK